MAVTLQALEAVRRRVLWGQLVGFGLWQGLTLLGSLVPGAGRWALVASLPAWAVWMYGFVDLARLGRAVRADPRLAAALDDERLRHVRLRALAVGFWALLGLHGLLLALAALGVVLPPEAGPRLSILVGVVSATGALLVLERE